MENFDENIIYIQEENCLKDINIKEEVEEDSCVENNKLIKMEDYEKSEVNHEIINGTASGYQLIGIKEEAVDEDISNEALEMQNEVNYDINFKKEELNFMDSDFDRNFINAVAENKQSSTLKTENISYIKNYTGQVKSSDDTVENFPLEGNSYKSGESSVDSSQSSVTNLNVKSKLQSRKFYKCTKCNFSTFHKIQIRSHFESHKVKSESGQASASKSELNDLNKIDHINLKTFRKSDFDNTASKEAQIRIMPKAGENPLQCRDCDYVASCNSKLNRHMKIHAGGLFKCDYCDYSASRRDHVRDHKRTHTCEKRHKCDFCDYRTSEKARLQTHTRIHTGEKPFRCTFCNYAASDKSVLQKHIRIHTGEKPYKCPNCDYTATQRTHLQDHIRIHTGEKPFQCNKCDFCTSFKSALGRHLKTHTGEKPYKCDYCDYCSLQRSHLLNHVRIHTGEKPFQCDFCDHRTADKSSLRKHTKIHTKEKQSS